MKSLAAVGARQDQIGQIMCIRSVKTLRKHFRIELDYGKIQANAEVARTLYTMATSGKCVAATIFWLKCQAGWREHDSPQSPMGRGGDFIVVATNTVVPNVIAPHVE